MRNKKYSLTLLVLFFCVGFTYAQEKRTEISVDFRVNSAVIDSAYSNNAARMQEMIDFLSAIRLDSTINIVEVSFCGGASPDGNVQINRRLARARLTALEKFVRKEVDIPDSIITRNDNYISWNDLKLHVENSELIHRDEVLAILNEKSLLGDYQSQHIDNHIVKLKKMDNGKVWQQLNKLFFEQMRNAYAVFVTYKKEIPPMEEPVVVPDTIKEEPIVDTTVIVENIPEEWGWNRKLHLKTNAVGLGLAVANVAAEIDLAKHWSFAVPVYYSAWNYFKATIKIRTLALQPEFRYWFSDENDGFFTGAHFGLAYYNITFNGDYRYQDHDRRNPSLGGGVSVGYRMPISKSNRWRVEFSLGAGVYSRYYDKYENTPRTSNGLLIESVKKTYWGIDQVAVSFSYSFDLGKKGGKL